MADKPTRRGFIFENDTVKKLKWLAQHNRRSLSQMLAFLVDEAYLRQAGTSEPPTEDETDDSHAFAA